MALGTEHSLFRFCPSHLAALLSTGSVETIIHDHLHMHKVSARWIPRLLIPFQKQERAECSRINLEMCQEDESTFFKRLITQDETWVHHYDPETKAQSMQWKHLDSPPPKKARVQPSAGKVMLTVFWDQDGVVMTDFLEKGNPPPAGQRSSPQLACHQIRSTGVWL